MPTGTSLPSSGSATSKGDRGVSQANRGVKRAGPLIRGATGRRRAGFRVPRHQVRPRSAIPWAFRTLHGPFLRPWRGRELRAIDHGPMPGDAPGFPLGCMLMQFGGPPTCTGKNRQSASDFFAHGRLR
jgi:hypothetical protein